MTKNRAEEIYNYISSHLDDWTGDIAEALNEPHENVLKYCVLWAIMEKIDFINDLTA